MSESSEISQPSPGNSEIPLDLQVEPEPVDAADTQATANNEPTPDRPGELVDRADSQPGASLEQQTFGEIVDGQADAPTGGASDVAARPDSEPPG